MAITSAEGSYQDFSYNGQIQQLIIPQDGLYMLEVWGAKGGNFGSYSGGNGGYSKGYKEFAQNTILYVVCGGSGAYYTTYTNTTAGGYNGGGKSNINSRFPITTGGGATHIATKTGLLNALSGVSNIIIVAGGGGGAGGKLDGASYIGNAAGGAGGGASGGNGGTDAYGAIAGGGTQSAGGKAVQPGVASGYGIISGSFGTGGGVSLSLGGSGGGGYYGGAGGSDGGGGGGGSGYIGGVPTIVFQSQTYTPSTVNNNNNGAGRARITYVKSAGTYNLYHNTDLIKSIAGKSVTDVIVNGITVFKN